MKIRSIVPWKFAIVAAALMTVFAQCAAAADMEPVPQPSPGSRLTVPLPLPPLPPPVAAPPSPAAAPPSSQPASTVTSSQSLPATVLVVDAINFDAEVLKSRTQVVVLFYTAGDPWSQKELPLFLEAARTHAGQAKFVVIDVGVNRQVATALQVKMAPTVMVRRALGMTSACESFAHSGYLEPDQLLLVIDGGLAFTKP